MYSDYLFNRGSLGDYLENIKNSIKQEINREKTSYILNVDEEQYCKHLTEKYNIQVPILTDKKEIIDRKEIRIQSFRGFGMVDGNLITIAITFEGDGSILYYYPSTFYPGGFKGTIKGQEVHISFEIAEDERGGLKDEIEKSVKKLGEWFNWTRNDIESYNMKLKSDISRIFKNRKKKLMDEQDFLHSLDIPLRKIKDVPETYTIPSIQKKTKILRPKVSEKHSKPEPKLSDEDYFFTLKIINNMSLAMERSPRTFHKLKEEEIRDFFLIFLNGHYEGQATGETFNYQGKTDILIRFENRNVFIAECKFWTGPEGLTKTINQLLKYLSWRDTKTAILIFNKDIDPTTVKNKITPTVRSHENYVEDFNIDDQKLKSETIFSYKLHQPGYENRILYLTVMVFNIPKLDSS